MALTSTYTASQQGFIPPFYGKLAKDNKDLFKKRYEFEHTVKSINRSAKGVRTESGAVLSEAGLLRGFLKGVYSGSDYGVLDTELYTDASQDSKALFRFNKLSPGVGFNIFASSNDKTFRRPVVGTELDYQREFMAANVLAKSDGNVHKVEGSATVGYNGMTVGATGVIDASKGVNLLERNFGGEYKQSDFVASSYTEKNASIANFAYIQVINRNHLLGANFKYELKGSHARSLQIGTEYKLDAATIVKGKLDLPSGDVVANVEHRLAEPRALVSVSTQFNAKSAKFSADKLGIGLTLGDF